MKIQPVEINCCDRSSALPSPPPRFCLSGRSDFTGGRMIPPCFSKSAQALSLFLALLLGVLCLLDAAPAAAQTPQLAVRTKQNPVEGGGPENGGIVIVTVWIHPSAKSTEVTLILGGTATKGTDYRIDAETFSFPPGTGSQTTNLRIIDDHVHDPGETITIRATSAGLRDSNQVTLTINDDNDAPLTPTTPTETPTETPQTPPVQTPTQTPAGGGGGGGGGGGLSPAQSSDASLSSLEISEGTLIFSPGILSYEVTANLEATEVTVTPTASDTEARITVNDEEVTSGESKSIELDQDGVSVIRIKVTAEDEETERTYVIRVARGDECGINNKEALARFYGATGGDMWEENDNWNTENPLGEWYGVSIDENEKVVSLLLADNNLRGDMPEQELLCLSELKELALWGNDGLSGEVPEKLVLAVERAVLRDIAEMLNLNPQWFENYEDPFDFEDWHTGVTTDDEGRVTRLDLTGEGVMGEVPESVSELQRLREIMITTSEGGCALSPEDDSSALGLFLVTLLVFAVLGRRRAR